MGALCPKTASTSGLHFLSGEEVDEIGEIGHVEGDM
jgi:hypothetical protein